MVARTAYTHKLHGNFNETKTRIKRLVRFKCVYIDGGRIFEMETYIFDSLSIYERHCYKKSYHWELGHITIQLIRRKILAIQLTTLHSIYVYVCLQSNDIIIMCETTTLII